MVQEYINTRVVYNTERSRKVRDKFCILNCLSYMKSAVVLLFLIAVALVVFGVILWPLAQYFHFLAMSIVQIFLGLASMVLGVVLVLLE